MFQVTGGKYMQLKENNLIKAVQDIKQRCAVIAYCLKPTHQKLAASIYS
jgi:hypothetical protein